MDELLAELARIDELATARADYLKSIALIRELKAGTVTVDEVTLTENGWQVTKQEPPTEPPGDDVP